MPSRKSCKVGCANPACRHICNLQNGWAFRLVEKRAKRVEIFPLKLPQNGLSSTWGGWCHLYLIFRFLIRKEEAVLFSDKKLHFRSWQFCKIASPQKRNPPLKGQTTTTWKSKAKFVSVTHFLPKWENISWEILVRATRHILEILAFATHKNKLNKVIFWPVFSGKERSSGEPCPPHWSWLGMEGKD